MAKKTISKSSTTRRATTGATKNKSAALSQRTPARATKATAKSAAKNTTGGATGKTAPAAKKKARLTSAHIKKNSSTSVAARVKISIEKLTEKIESLFDSRPTDIVAAIKMDHDGLRNFMSVLKDTDRDMTERRRAYAQFTALLKSHSQSEEKALYQTALEMSGHELHIKVTEGFVEHRLADDLMKRIEAAEEALEWSAHVNVLSEIIEHHLKEEERDLLPIVRRGANPKLDREMLDLFLNLRAATQTRFNDNNGGALTATAESEDSTTAKVN